jgi:hypothetical protein
MNELSGRGANPSSDGLMPVPFRTLQSVYLTKRQNGIKRGTGD